mmetsp:Transcript_832/g.1689  ORF Transcript_832/g.1689 Transcript_832/m.1689 type:complete len:408 (-) Transcript_832:190-1413(-)
MFSTHMFYLISVLACALGDEADDASLLQVQLSSVRTQAGEVSERPVAGHGGHHPAGQSGHRASKTLKLNGSSELGLHQTADARQRAVTPRRAGLEERLALKHSALQETTRAWRSTQALAAMSATVVVVSIMLAGIFCYLMVLHLMGGRGPIGGRQLAMEPSPIPVGFPQPPVPLSTSALVSVRGSPVFGVKGLPGRPGSEAPEPVFEELNNADTYVQKTASPSASVPLCLTGVPLCPWLIVPDGSRFVCLVKSCITTAKQSVAFKVTSPPLSANADLFRVNVSEFGSRPGISIETNDGLELAFLSTEAHHTRLASTAPALNLFKPDGALYGSIQMHANGCRVFCEDVRVLDLSGNVAKHHVNVASADGKLIAATKPLSAEEYEVSVFSGVDAGLVILALMAASKCCE